MSKHITNGKGRYTTRWREVTHAWCKKVLFKMFAGLRFGTLTINNCGKIYEFGDPHHQSGIAASAVIHDPRFYLSVLFKGSLGAGESYMKGYWSTNNLTEVVRLFTSNADFLNRKLDGGWSRISAPILNIYHWFHKNTYKGSRKNIAAHYDLSNDFFKLFLDESMGYSCGIFEDKHSTLHEAQIAKFDRICRKLRLSEEDHVVEVGGGWGGFARYAAENYGCRVTTTTISEEQFSYMNELVLKFGLTDRIEVLKKDYRKLTGKFDKLVSIEMIEAVGHHYLDTFFDCCCRLLKPDGMMALQAITIPDHEFRRHKHSVDFIKRYIFPGSCIPSVAAIMKSIARKTDLRLTHFEDITPHYATTLRHWRERFCANLEKVKEMGCSENFIRMWEFYLASCEGSFQERYNGDVHMIFSRPQCRHEPILPHLSTSTKI